MLLRNVILTAILPVVSVMFAWAAQREEMPQKVETLVETKKIASEIIYAFDRSVGAGRLIKKQHGRDGEIRRTYEITRDSNGKVVDRKLVEEESTKPIHTIMAMGRAGFAPSRSSFTRSSVRTMNSTAYTPSAGRKNPTFRTATGRKAEFGVIAVDPRVIKLNSLVYVEGYGFAIAADTGGAIKGNIIDVCLPTEKQCRTWGRKKVRVHLFKERHK